MIRLSVEYVKANVYVMCVCLTVVIRNMKISPLFVLRAKNYIGLVISLIDIVNLTAIRPISQRYYRDIRQIHSVHCSDVNIAIFVGPRPLSKTPTYYYS